MKKTAFLGTAAGKMLILCLRFFELAVAVLVLPLSTLAFTAGVFGLFCIVAFNAAFSVKGCGWLLVAALLLWLWACWRSEERALRLLLWLLRDSALLLLFFVGVSILGFMMRHRDSITAWHVIALMICVVSFWFLRGVAVHRNRGQRG